MSQDLNLSISKSSTNTSLSDNIIYINEKLIKNISLILEKVIKLNRNRFKRDKNIFNCGNIPNISLYNYLYRIKKYSKIDDNTLILSLIYIDRICSTNKILINYYNVHKILLASIVSAIKFNEDNYYSNSFYSKIGGITSNELELLEMEFASIINFKYFVKKSLFDKYYRYINNDYIFENINHSSNIYEEN